MTEAAAPLDAAAPGTTARAAFRDLRARMLDRVGADGLRVEPVEDASRFPRPPKELGVLLCVGASANA